MTLALTVFCKNTPRAHLHDDTGASAQIRAGWKKKGQKNPAAEIRCRNISRLFVMKLVMSENISFSCFLLESSSSSSSCCRWEKDFSYKLQVITAYGSNNVADRNLVFICFQTKSWNNLLLVYGTDQSFSSFFLFHFIYKKKIPSSTQKHSVSRKSQSNQNQWKSNVYQNHSKRHNKQWYTFGEEKGSTSFFKGVSVFFKTRFK